MLERRLFKLGWLTYTNLFQHGGWTHVVHCTIRTYPILGAAMDFTCFSIVAHFYVELVGFNAYIYMREVFPPKQASRLNPLALIMSTGHTVRIKPCHILLPVSRYAGTLPYMELAK